MMVKNLFILKNLQKKQHSFSDLSGLSVDNGITSDIVLNKWRFPSFYVIKLRTKNDI